MECDFIFVFCIFDDVFFNTITKGKTMTNEQMKKIGQALMAFGAVLAEEGFTFETAKQNDMVEKAETTAAQIVEEVKTKDEPKEKRTRKKATAPETKEVAPEVDNEVKQMEPKGAASFTHDDLRKSLVDFAKKFGKQKAYDLLAEFGAKKAIEVPEDKLGMVFTRMDSHA